jgi:ribosomal protein S18 acetylase RimI-like enzyme
MSLAELDLVIGWAAEEGWNPGLDDAAAFYAADPGGFLMAKLDGEPVSAVSVVRHAPDFAFLGLYICRPDCRGRGLGWAVWQAGIDLAGARSIGLDGVVAQQDNYRKSGFDFSHRTIRFEGAPPPASHGFEPFAASDMNAALALDRRIVGIDRPAYLSPWLSGTATRRTLVGREDGATRALGTIRACGTGHKIGPLFAPDAETARHLIGALAAEAGAEHVIVDVPERNAAAVRMVEDLGFQPAFETARMYRGPAPAQDIPQLFGEATLELG